ncbi:hypothetical protein [Caproicibacterium amylolyticum]|uniref:Uncharacterized protein n=1 Tax=Caproicibacterium amylolyticum TaxID=2766537 RepID=A0A7G9WJZ2_9FIRM|nr:hypothetical protein [Caproicibacterium amylolyticum]QNO19004.1 hypothetical protein H6X83_05125 [Caproicibacterium amylolyticum]
MRSLNKDKKSIWFAKKLPPVPEKDENGLETGNMISCYDEPAEFHVNVQPITDTADIQEYGADVSKMQKCVFTPFDVEGYSPEEFEAAWYGVTPNGNLRDDDAEHQMNNNYTVKQVIFTGWQYAVYIKKVAGTET